MDFGVNNCRLISLTCLLSTFVFQPKTSGGKVKRIGGRRGRKPSKIDQKAKLERSRQSARECRARKKQKYLYLEETVANKERAICALREELDMVGKIYNFCDFKMLYNCDPSKYNCQISEMKLFMVDSFYPCRELSILQDYHNALLPLLNIPHFFPGSIVFTNNKQCSHQGFVVVGLFLFCFGVLFVFVLLCFFFVFYFCFFVCFKLIFCL